MKILKVLLMILAVSNFIGCVGANIIDTDCLKLYTIVIENRSKEIVNFSVDTDSLFLLTLDSNNDLNENCCNAITNDVIEKLSYKNLFSHSNKLSNLQRKRIEQIAFGKIFKVDSTFMKSQVSYSNRLGRTETYDLLVDIINDVIVEKEFVSVIIE